MIFYTIESGKSMPADAEFPRVIVKHDNWNDWGFETLFQVTLQQSKSRSIELGQTKILQKEHKETKLPAKFSRLPKAYCSLGQSLAFYEQVHELGESLQNEILLGLRDIVAYPHFAAEFEGEKGFRDSLLRFSEAEKTFHEGGLILSNTPIKKKAISFRYSAKLAEATAPHVVDIRLGDSEVLPCRTMIFIGKNGTGKTWFLSKLAADISGDDARDAHFQPRRPSFSRVVAVSYNAFDRFRRPPTGERSFSYRYCGIYDSEGQVLPRTALTSRIATAYQDISSSETEHIWHVVLQQVFGKDFADVCARMMELDDPVREMKKLSSGQMILLTVFTELLTALEKDSLILYDEPELHLHPNAISGLMRALAIILRKYNSYCIIATHSPLILQQVPADYVRVFTRMGQQTFIRPLGIESFGENLSVLTEEVFQVNASETIFKRWIRSVADRLPESDILNAFSRPLSFQAKSFLRTHLERAHRKEK